MYRHRGIDVQPVGYDDGDSSTSHPYEVNPSKPERHCMRVKLTGLNTEYGYPYAVVQLMPVVMSLVDRGHKLHSIRAGL